MTSFRRKRLGEILVGQGHRDRGADQRGPASEPTDARSASASCLIDEGLITEEVLAQALAEQRDLRYADLMDFRITPTFFETIPVELMQRYQFVPMEDTGDVLHRGHDRPQQSSAPSTNSR